MVPITYVQRIVRNYLQSMAPLPGDLMVAGEHLRAGGVAWAQRRLMVGDVRGCRQSAGG